MGSNQEEDPTQPRDLTGLLKFCLQNVDGDVPGSAGVSEMDEEKKKFLAEALASLTSSPIDQLKKGIEFVNNRLNEIDGSTDPNVVNEAIGSIQDCVENIIVDTVSQVDFANDFYKLNGLELINRLMATSIPKLIISSCDIIAETVQNNPNAQNIVTEHGFLVELLKIVEGNVTLKRTFDQMELNQQPSIEDGDVQAKALYAVSCLIRQNETSLKVFESNNGYGILIKSIVSKSKNQKLRIKSSFLLMALIQSNPSLIRTITELGFIGHVLKVLSEPHDESHEHLLSVINFLVTENEQSKNEVRTSGLKTVLGNKLKELDGKEEHKEELKYCKNILKLCFI